MSYTGGEGCDVFSEAVVGILQPSVQVRHTVITLVSEIEFVRVADQLRAEDEGQVRLQEADHGVDEGGGNGNGEPLCHHQRKLADVLSHDVLDNLAL